MPRVLGLAMLVDTASWEVLTLRARDPVLLVTTVQPDQLRQCIYRVLLANTASGEMVHALVAKRDTTALVARHQQHVTELAAQVNIAAVAQ